MEGSLSNSLIAFPDGSFFWKGGERETQWHHGKHHVVSCLNTSQMNTESLLAPSSPLLLSLSAAAGERSLGLVPFSLAVRRPRPGLKLCVESDVEPCFTACTMGEEINMF